MTLAVQRRTFAAIWFPTAYLFPVVSPSQVSVSAGHDMSNGSAEGSSSIRFDTSILVGVVAADFTSDTYPGVGAAVAIELVRGTQVCIAGDTGLTGERVRDWIVKRFLSLCVDIVHFRIATTSALAAVLEAPGVRRFLACRPTVHLVKRKLLCAWPLVRKRGTEMVVRIISESVSQDDRDCATARAESAVSFLMEQKPRGAQSGAAA